MTKTPNHLINEQSPYLKQHAYNPVNWYPWSDEAFNKAQKDDKPIFLSIGYSTCHWCHVMERESFEDEYVASIMNEHFVSIKVDREERPDVDNIYMMTCQLMTNSGGWPLSIFMTPDKKPFFAGTYFPKENAYGRIGFINLLNNVKSIWLEKRKEIDDNADNFIDYLNRVYSNEGTKQITDEVLHRAFNFFNDRFDAEFGGFGEAPKFPSPHNLMFLLRYWKRFGDENALNIVSKTLTEMRNGGIFDHIGFGFHRYSTDKYWLVPHFEKMLYDQAMLLIVYTEGFQATGNLVFKQTAKEIVEYVLRDMTSPEGTFYSAEDADSEGVEGKFYLWNIDEIQSLLNKKDAETFCNIFNMKSEGNFKDESGDHSIGNNILHFSKTISQLSDELRISPDKLNSSLERSRTILFETRNKRIHPLKDDKILTDWNGLMLAALAKAGSVFNNPEYIEAASKCADFIINKINSGNDVLLHKLNEGVSKIDANLDDYAFLINGLLELYQSSFNQVYLKTAIKLTDKAIECFWDNINSGFYYSQNEKTDLIVRTKEHYDGAIPSGNSIMMLNMVLLNRFTLEPRYNEICNSLLNAFSQNIDSTPYGMSMMLCAYDFLIGPSIEIIIINDKDDKIVSEFLKKLNKEFIPNKVILLQKRGEENLFEYLDNYKAEGGHTTFYICKDGICSLPTTDIDTALTYLT